ncbi:MAG: hypothetical protein COA96_13635 [SAR86 cluster bacterium]|uniref:UPF0056 membrane protein n=1 Tax=SAR86 cluster bacterium TaxID=2030880 RepID=A0A2A5ATS2_9GAMM|nr:MAG: hypothetical protein COA96_13635 [SAR86 cluster bacterium]
MSTLLIAANEQAGDLVNLVLMSVVCMLLAATFTLCFYFASPMAKAIWVSGIAVITRLMGLVLTAIACGMITSGLIGLFPGLGPGV